MNKYLLLLLLLPVKTIYCQTYNDEALLYSRSSITGTARTAGTAGAVGSVGADLGSLAVNPAGIGLYRSSDLSITPGLVINNNEAQFNGSFKNQSATKISINQAGIAFTKVFKKASSNNDFSFNSVKLNTFSFAINYQRQNNFSRTINFDGYNATNSGIDVYNAYLNSTKQPLSTDNYPVEMVLAHQANLLGYDTVSGNYFSNVHGPLQQAGTIATKGGVDQIDLTLGGNVNDKFYFGAGLGVPILTYFNDASFSEYNSKDSLSRFQDYTFSTNLRTTGIGVNAKFGIIYRPAAWMRLGVAYQTPTFYNITETYSANMTASFDTAYNQISAQAYPFKYKMRSPMKGTVSASFYLKEHGFFSVDYEFQNYGSSRFNFGNDYKGFTASTNADEKKYYTFGHVVRAGFEGSYKSLRARVGYSFSSTPYKKDFITKGFAEATHSATAGIGYRGKHFYADFAYVFGFTKDATVPYADFEVRNTLTSHRMLLTLGWKIFREETAVKKTRQPKMNF